MQLVRQVILLIYHKVHVEQSQTFREINNNLFNELKLSRSGLSLLLVEIYLFSFKVAFFFFCGCWSFLLLLAERFFQSWGHMLILKGRVKK